MITTILWDVDATLLDFEAAERTAIKSLFAEYDLGDCTDSMLERYSVINRGFWQRLERNELSKPEILVGRFKQFLEEYGFDTSIASEFNEKYQIRLGDTIVYRDDSFKIVKSLIGKVKQYVVSNGTVVAQTRKLERSGFGELVDGVFLSEDLGVEKPNIGFFEKAFDVIRPDNLSEILIVGDSLTSDMQGGINAQIKTCWYNPGKLSVPEDYKLDYVISDLHEVMNCLEAESVK